VTAVVAAGMNAGVYASRTRCPAPGARSRS
jgi:hypothetical protein